MRSLTRYIVACTASLYAQHKLNVFVFEVPGQYDNHPRPEVQFGWRRWFLCS
jgi:hypothetical protein